MKVEIEEFGEIVELHLKPEFIMAWYEKDDRIGFIIGHELFFTKNTDTNKMIFKNIIK